ncbi:MAG: hypothetical protein WC030_00160 [Candidatus Paceibacterota bacterium]
MNRSRMMHSCIVVLVLIVAGGLAYCTHNGTTQEPQTSSTGQIEWRVIDASKPFKTVKSPFAPSYGPAPIMAVHDVATFHSGPYAGSHLYYARGTNRITYGYFIGDAGGNPIAWWGDLGWRRGPKGDIEALGLLNLPLAPADTFPTQLYLPGTQSEARYVTDSNGHRFQVWATDLYASDWGKVTPVTPTTTVSGSTLARPDADTPDYDADDIEEHFVEYGYMGSRPTYVIQTPIGIWYGANLVTDFSEKVLHMEVPGIAWKDGSSAIAQYDGGALYAKEQCYKDFKTMHALEVLFVQTGTTHKDSTVYEIDSQKNSAVHQCLYSLVDMTKSDAPSYAEFLAAHPVVFWKDPYGYWYNMVQFDLFVRGQVDGNV